MIFILCDNVIELKEVTSMTTYVNPLTELEALIVELEDYLSGVHTDKERAETNFELDAAYDEFNAEYKRQADTPCLYQGEMYCVNNIPNHHCN